MKLSTIYCGLGNLLLIALFPFLLEAQDHVILPTKMEAIPLFDLANKTTHLSLTKPVVIVFLSPECPLCKNYLPGLVKLQNANKHIRFYGVVPGKSYTPKEILALKNKYNINFNLVIDRNKKLVNYLKATTTPEVFLINQLGGITYSGLIDNWANDLGQKRIVITEKYLEKALNDLRAGKHPYKKTIPVGCLINDI